MLLKKRYNKTTVLNFLKNERTSSATGIEEIKQALNIANFYISMFKILYKNSQVEYYSTFTFRHPQ